MLVEVMKTPAKIEWQHYRSEARWVVGTEEQARQNCEHVNDEEQQYDDVGH